MEPDQAHTAKPPSDPRSGVSPPLRVIDAPTLFGKASEVRIRHNTVEYRLCITRQGKLILTK